MKRKPITNGPNQKQLAQSLGVSQMTISRVINNRAGVRSKLRRIILSKIRARGYVRDRWAAGLRGKANHVIGLVIPDVSNSFFPDITAGIERRASAQGYRVILAHSHESYEREAGEIALLREYRVEGFIIAPAGGPRDIATYRCLQKAGIPFVFIDRYKKAVACDCVVTDFETGACDLGRYLRRQGYRRWGYIQGPEGVTSSDEHARGLRRSLAEAGKSRIRADTVGKGFEEEDGYRGAAELLLMGKPDLIVASNDSVAIGAYRYLKEKGLRVPDDVALAGFSNLMLTDLLAVPLTTVAEQTVEMGCRAFDLLARRIAKPNAKIVAERLPPRLIMRASA